MRNLLRITGCWTKAGVVSCVRVQGDDRSVDILFDCGAVEEGTTAAKIVLISHGHTDHVGAAVIHARAKALSGSPATYYVPQAILEPLNAAKAAFEVMDDGSIPMKIVAINPGDEVMITPTVKVKVIRTQHRVPSQGYALYVIIPPKLLPEYENLHPRELGEMKRSGVKILGEPVESLQMVYTGDTVFAGLLQPENLFIFDAPVLIMELTYLDRDISKAIQYGHVHIQDIVDNEEVFNNDQIVFVHLSQKYSVNSALDILRSKLPRSIAERAKVSLYSFGASEYLTDIMPSRSDSHSESSRRSYHGGRQPYKNQRKYYY